MSPELAFQTVIFAEVAAALPLVPAGAHPPHDAPLPYIQFGTSDTEDDPGGHRVTMSVHFWSNTEGPHEATEMRHAVRTRLHGQSFTSNGWRFTCIRETFGDVIIDIDDETWHGIARFRAFASIG